MQGNSQIRGGQQNGAIQYNNQIHESVQNNLMDNRNQNQQHHQIELQNINLQEANDEHEHVIPDSEREEDLKNLVGILLGKVQLKRMEPALLIKLQNMEQFYDLLPFNIRGFKLVNRASLLEANFTDKYILKQTQDLNLDLHIGQFEKHYLVDAAIKVVKTTPCWSFFITLIIFMFFLLHLLLDPILMDIIKENQVLLDEQIDVLNGKAHTSKDDEVQSSLENETLAISFLIPLLSIRLMLWFLDLTLRFIALQFFRKRYILWTLLLDFILICITVIIGGFTTRLDASLEDNNQTRVELLIRNFIIFILFIVAMVQARKALGVIKRLSLLYTQEDKQCCNFQPY